MSSKKTALAVVEPFRPSLVRRKSDPLSGIIPPAKAPVMPHQRKQLEDLILSCVDGPLTKTELERLSYIVRRAHGQGVAAGMKAGKKKSA